MVSKVAIVKSDRDVKTALKRAIELVGGINDLNTPEKDVVVKVGVFDHSMDIHTTVDVAGAIIETFDKSPRVFVAESDNYRGKGSERLQKWKRLFGGRVQPFNLSEDADARKVKIAGEQIGLSYILFKPNALISTHVLRGVGVKSAFSDKGVILKNLLGLIPDAKKARFHKKLDVTLTDIYEAVGGIDLAVLDATYVYGRIGGKPKSDVEKHSNRVQMDTLIVGRDAVAVEAIGGMLIGLNPEVMPVVTEAVRRGLGEADREKIKVVGESFEKTKEKFSAAVKTLKGKKKRGGED